MRRPSWFLAPSLLALALAHSLASAPADPPAPATNRQQQAYTRALARYQAATNDVQAAWEFGRATFDLAELAPNARQREDLAQQGVAACRAALAQEPGTAHAHYYLGLNLGQIARVRRFTALGLVHQMEHAVLAAQRLDPALDHAGPDRILGLLYREAPGWPISIGNKSKARTHLEAAAKRAHDYPENRLNLAESFIQWKRPESALPQVAALRKLLPEARKRLSGPDWAEAWQDWDERWARLLQAVAPIERAVATNTTAKPIP